MLESFPLSLNVNFKTEPVKTELVKAESVKTEGSMAIRELVPLFNKAIKTEAKASPSADADNEVVFLGTTRPPSAPPLGRCSCGRLCDHAPVPVIAPAPSPVPDTKPVTQTDEPFAASSRALEVVDLISEHIA
ncbi:hypothetical protein LRP88_05462 [Fusarium phalaenopsidis]